MTLCLSTMLLLWSALIGCLPHALSLSNITCFTCNNCPAVTSETSRTFCSELLAARLEPYCITTTTSDGAIHRGCGKPDASFQDGCRNHTNTVTMETELVCGCDQSECNGDVLKARILLNDVNQLTTKAHEQSNNRLITATDDNQMITETTIQSTLTATVQTENKSTTKANDQLVHKNKFFKKYGVYMVMTIVVLTLVGVSVWLMLDEPWCQTCYRRCLGLKVTRHQRDEMDMDWLNEESVTGPQTPRTEKGRSLAMKTTPISRRRS